MRTREQERSKACWEALADPARFSPDAGTWRDDSREESKYLAALKKTSSRVYVSGLGMAIAFLRSRKQDINGHLAHDLGRLTLWAMGRQTGGDPALELIETIRNSDDVATVAWATEEALAACAWLIRYLEGEGVEAKDEDDQGGGEDG